MNHESLSIYKKMGQLRSKMLYFWNIAVQWLGVGHSAQDVVLL